MPSLSQLLQQVLQSHAQIQSQLLHLTTQLQLQLDLQIQTNLQISEQRILARLDAHHKTLSRQIGSLSLGQLVSNPTTTPLNDTPSLHSQLENTVEKENDIRSIGFDGEEEEEEAGSQLQGFRVPLAADGNKHKERIDHWEGASPTERHHNFIPSPIPPATIPISKPTSTCRFFKTGSCTCAYKHSLVDREIDSPKTEYSSRSVSPLVAVQSALKESVRTTEDRSGNPTLLHDSETTQIPPTNTQGIAHESGAVGHLESLERKSLYSRLSSESFESKTTGLPRSKNASLESLDSSAMDYDNEDLFIPNRSSSRPIVRSTIANNSLSRDSIGAIGPEPCRYFALGACKRGSTCNFAHASTKESDQISITPGSRKQQKDTHAIAADFKTKVLMTLIPPSEPLFYSEHEAAHPDSIFDPNSYFEDEYDEAEEPRSASSDRNEFNPFSRQQRHETVIGATIPATYFAPVQSRILQNQNSVALDFKSKVLASLVPPSAEPLVPFQYLQHGKDSGCGVGGIGGATSGGRVPVVLKAPPVGFGTGDGIFGKKKQQ
ncbi:UNVERIFIED_CONTAM: hypothetical protein HDU68_003598 [Siphonaria sp. JEL0065]|nr:hypothetical protein HDU68_003598 [Siphonaria sp. JEL0065]